MNNVYQLECPPTAEECPPEGTRRMIDGEERVLYDGYWIKTYPVPADTLEAKKRLIEGLTRRLFNHTEHGLNIPGTRLNEAKAAHEAETDPARKRVKAAMLAGAYFNRATDIFRKLVELQADGVEIRSDDALMRECGKCLLDAMELGRFVLHRSGEEGIDELWGEPFRAFSIPLEDFYESPLHQDRPDDARHRPHRQCHGRQFHADSGLRLDREDRCATSPMPPRSRPKTCAPTPTYSRSGRNWSPPPNDWPISPRRRKRSNAASRTHLRPPGFRRPAADPPGP